MATIPEYQGNYVYGQTSTNAHGHREFECFRTSASERFYIKGIAAYDRNVTAIFWYVISQIEIFLKVKVAKTWIILTISSDKKGTSRTAVLANKIEIQTKLNFDTLEKRIFSLKPLPEEGIESVLYHRQFLKDIPFRSDSGSVSNDSLDKISQYPELSRRLRYSGITKSKFEEVCGKLTDLTEAYTTYYRLDSQIVAPIALGKSELVASISAESKQAESKMLAYCAFLARVISRKHEVEDKSKTVFDYDLAKLKFDTDTNKMNREIDDALITTDADNSSSPITLRTYLATVRSPMPVMPPGTGAD